MTSNDKNVPGQKPRSKWGAPNFNISDNAKSDPQPQPIKRKSFKPKQEPLKSSEPFDGQTGNKRDYVEHPIKPRKPKPKDSYKPPSEKFEGSSTARNDFRGEVVPKRVSYKPENEPNTSNKPFEGASTANQDFKEHQIQKRATRNPSEYKKPEGAVVHNTINKDTYKEHPVQKQVVKKPESAKAMKGEGPMEKQTNHMKDYPGWEATRPQKAKRPKYVPPQEKMDDTTSSKVDYPAHKSQKREGFKPKDDAMKWDDPFDGYTGYNDTYKEHPIQPKEQRKRDGYQPPTEPMATSTSNKNDYPEHQAQKRQSFKPNGDALKSDDPFDGYTGYKDTYKEHPIQAKQKRKQDGYQPPTESMATSTSNKNDYPEHQAKKRQSYKPKGDALKSDDPFDGYTGYNDTYKEHPIQPQHKRKQDGYQPPSESMATSASNKNDYPEHEAQKRKSFKPNGGALKSDDPFDGYTGYNDTYKEHPIQPKQQRKRDGYEPPTESMATSTSNKNDYPEHQAQKRQSFKPNGDALKSDDPFDGYTGYNDTYKEHPIQPKQKRKQDGYQPPSESMAISTSNKNDYPEHEAQKRKSFKPNGDALKSDDPFDGYTGYNDTYREHPIQPKQQRKRDGYQPPTESMATSTSNKNDYPEHQAQKRQSFKPNGDALKSDDPFDGYTGYKDTYKEHPIQPKQKRKQDGYQPPTESMATSTSNKNDYPEHQAKKRQSFKPNGDALKSDDPFDGYTGYNDTYKEHPIQPKQQRKRDGYEPPTESMATSTSNKNDYPEHHVPKRQSFKPNGDALKSDDPFDGYTGYNDTYKEHPIQPKQQRKRDGYEPPTESMATSTSNKNDYPEHHVPKRQSFKPNGDALKSDNPFDGYTGYNATYKEHPIQPKQQQKRDGYEPPTESMATSTSNKNDYPEHEAQRRKSFKPNGDALKSDDPFDGYTGYNDTYREHPIQPKQQRKQNTYKPPTESMAMSTSNKNDYPEHQAQKRQSFKPNGDALKSDDPFDDYTGYKDTYKEHPIQPKQQRKRDSYQPPTESMATSTSNKNDYPEHQAQKRQSFKPNGDALKSDDPFDGYTGYNDTYKEHPIQPKQQRKRDEYEPPTESMATSTSNKNDYPEHEAQKRKSFKPNGDALKSDDPFDGYTGYNDTYREHPIQPKQQRKQDTYKPPTESMATSTSNKNDYPEHKAKKRQSFKPNGDALKSDDPFDDYTGYKNTYIEHPIQPKQQRKRGGYQPPTESMATSTSNKNDYPEHQDQKRRSFKPNGDALKSDDPFDGYTGYSDTYKEHPIQPKQQRKRDEYEPPTESMATLTSNKNDYPEHEAQKRKSFKPNGDALKSDDPFDGYTGYNDTYREHPIQPKQQRKRDGYQPPTESMATSTSNKNDYPEHPAQKRQSFKPNGDALKSDDPFDGYTGYNDTYREHPIQPKYQHQQDGYKPPTESMATSTSNKNDYPEHQAQKRQSFKPNGDALKSDDPFDGYTGYNDTYREHPIQPKQQRKQDAYKPPTESMATSTSNKNDYPEHQAKKRQSFKPNGDALKSDDPFDGYTGYNDTYREHPIQPKQQRMRDEYQPPTESMQTSTTNRDTFVENPLSKRQSCKRDTEPFSSNAPFDSSTTFSKDFQQWESERPTLKRHQETLKPEGEMDLNTINKQAFKGDLVSRPTIKKQGSSHALTGDGTFYGDSAYGSSYKQHDAVPRLKPTKDAYVPSEGKFYAETTNHADFLEQPYSKRNKYIPPDSTLKSHDPFAPTTGYQETFIEHQAAARVRREKEKYNPPTVPLETETTSHGAFKEVTAQKRSGYGPSKQAFRSVEPFTGTTTAKDSFKEYDVMKQPLVRQETYVKSIEPMDLQTTSKSSFKGDYIPRRSITRPRSSNTLKYEGKFTTETSYRGCFTQRDLPEKTTFKRATYEPPTVKFEGQTTNRADFGANQPTARTVSYKATDSWLRSSAPMIMSSSYKDSFTEVKPAPRSRREQEPYVPSSLKFEGISTFKSDFIGREGKKRDSYRPPKVAFQSNVPFDGTTTASSDFKSSWETTKPQRVRANMESFMQIDAKMNSSSTYRGDFESSKTVSWNSPPTLLGMA